jgi:hypothetical protein
MGGIPECGTETLCVSGLELDLLLECRGRWIYFLSLGQTSMCSRGDWILRRRRMRLRRRTIIRCRGDWIRTSDFLLPKQAL